MLMLSLEILSHLCMSTRDLEYLLYFDVSFPLSLLLISGLEESISFHERVKVLEHILFIVHSKSGVQTNLSRLSLLFHLKSDCRALRNTALCFL